MVSKEPNHLLTGHNNSKSTLADKLPGTMTVRSVLLNRDSPDIESRLKRRRNRTHQVRFKDLEDGSSSSGNSATGETNSHQKAATDCDRPHPLHKHSSRATKPWTDRDGPQAEALPGQTSVVGAVRGDMASTLEVMAAFLARAPPHPLTPGPTRRCWVPPQINSLTLPMTRRSGTSTSTAIQTSPCLKKPQSLSSTHTRSHSLGDSVGVDGDDEHDSQDEYLTHNHVPGSKEETSRLVPGERSGAERRAKSPRTDHKSAVAVVKNSRNSCSPLVLHNAEPCYCSSLSCRDSSKRQGGGTPSMVRRRKRLSRTTSDPGTEVSYCTTPTQTEGSRPPPAPSDNSLLCTTRVQTESNPPPDLKYCTTQSQTESPRPSPHPDSKQCTTPVQNHNSTPPPQTLLSAEHSTTPIQNDSPASSLPTHQPCTTTTHDTSLASPPTTSLPGSPQNKSASPCASPTLNQDPSTAQMTIVPYCTTPTPTTAPTPAPEHCATPPRSSPAEPARSAPSPPAESPQTAPCPVSKQHCIPYYTVVSPPTTPSTAVVPCTPPTTAASCPTQNSSDVVQWTPRPCATPTPSSTPIEPPSEPAPRPSSAPIIPHPSPTAASKAIPPTNPPSCTYVTQTALSCTSISYYTTTHSGPHLNSTLPSYATLIQTVSHCNIPVQNTSSAGRSVAPYSSPVPKLKSCTSPPPPLVQTYALSNAQPCVTPTKAAPLYSSTFRAAPPYTPPSQAPYNTQDKRGIRLPPPPPPPPPYTPRKEGSVTPGVANRIPMLRADSKAGEKDGEKEEKEDKKCTDSPKLCERVGSLKHRAASPSVAVMKGENQSSSSTSSPAKACFKSSCLSSAHAQLGVLHKMLCSGSSARPNAPNSQHPLPTTQQGCSGAWGCSASREGTTAGPLSATHADTLRQVQEIIGGLMSGARCKLDPSRVAEKLLSPNGPLHDIRSLQNQLQSLEGVLETSQNTIKVLLDVIQDLEKKEAERDGNSYRTGQDIENCGTCRDCACIIYSVEHDFRLQEGQVVRTWKVGDPPEGSPECVTPQPSTPHHQDSPQTPAAAKKNRKKCFWFL
ncbi:uncharacterized protein LOC143007035 isoform X2 [Genypterus blacodes]|uniref:uncharacterized protein LOC143007035 isoform X2 n=1 Tax=Genypterus blacodes TaxID=154954 RepID=UPI003F7745A6